MVQLLGTRHSTEVTGHRRGWRSACRAQHHVGLHGMHAHAWLPQGAWQRQQASAARAGASENALLEVEELNAAVAAAAAEPRAAADGRTAEASAWLPAGAAGALACLVAASCLRPGGRLSEAAAQLAHGRQLIGESFAALGVDLEVRRRSGQ